MLFTFSRKRRYFSFSRKKNKKWHRYTKTAQKSLRSETRGSQRVFYPASRSPFSWRMGLRTKIRRLWRPKSSSGLLSLLAGYAEKPCDAFPVFPQGNPLPFRQKPKSAFSGVFFQIPYPLCQNHIKVREKRYESLTEGVLQPHSSLSFCFSCFFASF